MSTSFAWPVSRSVRPPVTSISVRTCGERRVAVDADLQDRKVVRDLRGEPVVTFPCTGKDPAFCHEPLVAAHVHVEEIDLGTVPAARSLRPRPGRQ